MPAASSTAARASSSAARGVAAPRCGLRLHAPPGDRRLEVGAREYLGVVSERIGLDVAALQQQRPTQERGCLRGLAAQPARPQLLERRPQPRLGRGRVAVVELDEAGEHLRLEQAVREPEVLERAPGRLDHPPGGVDAAPQRLEHRLTPERDGLHRGRSGGDAEHADDIEAAPTGTGHRARAPQCGERRTREHGVREAPVAGRAGSRERAVQGRLGRTHPPQPRQRQRVHVVRLRLATHVADGLHGIRHGCDRLDDVGETLRLGEHRELGNERGVPGHQPRVTDRACGQRVDGMARDPDLTRGEQGFAPFELQVGATRVVAVEPVERPPEQSCRDR